MANKRGLPWNCMIFVFILIISTLAAIPPCHGGGHPFAAKASLLRFWRRVLPSARLPPFLLEKASPLNATSFAVFAGYIENHTLSDHIASFCTAAHLLCTRRLIEEKQLAVAAGDADFQSYHGKQFKHYKVGGRSGGTDSFKNYSDGDNVVKDDFKRYGIDGRRRSQVFANYAPQTNVEDEGFANYGSGGSLGKADFSTYGADTNVPDHHFKNYGADSNAGIQNFKSYADNSNAINNDFARYGKDANGISSDFSRYAENSNVANNTFKSYSEGGNGPIDRFTSYADNGNVPRNEFESYGSNGNEATQSFTSYADGANVPQDVFSSYGRDGTMTRRCQRYYKAGARCAQCRAVIKICRGEPSRAAVQENAESLARFAMICQRNGLVPILKLEILREGYTFDIQQCADATEIFSAALFKSLSDRRVLPEALLFMATMILPGSDGPDACPNHHLVVGYTLQALQRTVPVSVPAVFFDPLGQSKDDAILNLNLLNKMDAAKPWNMSFCFGREFQQCALVPWAGKDENIEETQKALVMLCQANSLAATGKWVKAP